MNICGFEVHKNDEGIYLAKINNAPNDLCIKIRKKYNNLNGNVVYASYCNYYFWGRGHPSPYYPTDPYIADTEENSVEYMLNIFKELMDEHNNDPEKFCWVPVYQKHYHQIEFCKHRHSCHQFEIEPDNSGWEWAHNSYSHIILGTGKIITKDRFRE